MKGQCVFVESACITSVAFDSESRVLQLEFTNGLIYEYRDVPESVCSDLLSAPSKGAFITRFIRGCFPFQRLQ
jgi:lysyl-tRNA synthetase class 2